MPGYYDQAAMYPQILQNAGSAIGSAFAAARESRQRKAMEDLQLESAKLEMEQRRSTAERAQALPEALMAANGVGVDMSGQARDISMMPGTDAALMQAAPQDYMQQQQAQAQAQSQAAEAQRKQQANVARYIERGLASGMKPEQASALAERYQIPVDQVGAFAAAELGAEKPEDTSRRGEMATKLRNEFQSMPLFKEAQTVAAAYDKVNGATPTAAGDMALIFGYMKLQDPSSSVREGEYATAQNAGSIPQRVVSAYNAILNGQKLTPEQRQDFRANAGRAFGAAKRRYDAFAGEYGRLAKESGVPVESVVLDPGFGRRGTGEATASRGGQVDTMAIATALKARVDKGEVAPEDAKAVYDQMVAEARAQAGGQ